ncbi:MAG TPA: diguanylate cyclase, partial [Burkholderiales bacterium]|nr:diguanylate cyclase [Burkholderiales bacterium]
MRDDARPLRLVRGLAFIIGLSVPLILPAVYFGLSYSNLSGAVATRASVKAEAVAALANRAGPLWRYQEHRLHEILELYPAHRQDETWIIRDASGGLVAQAGPGVSRFAIERTNLIYRQGEAIGVVEVTQPIFGLIQSALGVVALALAMGFALFGLLELVFVRMLKRAMHTAGIEKARAERNWEALHNEKERAEVTLHSIGDAVVTTDAAGSVEYLNPVAEEYTGWTSSEARGHALAEVLKLIHETTGETVENPMAIALAERRIVPLRQNTALKRRDGTTLCIEDTAAPIVDRRGQLIGGVLVFHDVSETRSMAERLSWQATHDSLTGLVNRSEFERRLEAAFATARRGASHVLCYLDLDQFKIVNDTCGHAAGDELLKQVASALHTRLRATDTLGRLGGDEFGILLEDCSMDDAKAVLQQIVHTVLNHRFVWDGKTFSIGMSGGLVRMQRETPSSGHALSAADAACYTAKEKGRGRIEVYEEHNDAAHRQLEMSWVSRIRRALDENRFNLYAQQFLPLNGSHDECIHLELLLRLIDEDGAVVSPAVFLPPAEHYG